MIIMESGGGFLVGGYDTPFPPSYIIGRRSVVEQRPLGFSDSYDRGPEREAPIKKTFIKLSCSRKIDIRNSKATGRYFAGVAGGMHVYEGFDMDELARNMVSLDGRGSLDIFFPDGSVDGRKVSIKPGLTKVRAGGRTRYISGSYEALPCDAEELLELLGRYRQEAILAKNERIARAEAESARNMELAAEKNKQIMRERPRQQRRDSSDDYNSGQSHIRHHGWTEPSWRF